MKPFRLSLPRPAELARAKLWWLSKPHNLGTAGEEELLNRPLAVPKTTFPWALQPGIDRGPPGAKRTFQGLHDLIARVLPAQASGKSVRIVVVAIVINSLSSIDCNVNRLTFQGTAWMTCWPQVAGGS